jgi:hypothetical protein
VAGNAADIFIEQSKNELHHGILLGLVPDTFHPLLDRWIVFYGPQNHPHANVLFHFGKHILPISIDGLHGERMTEAVFTGLGDLDGVWVMDPCMGRGMSSRMAHRFGANFLGLELDPARLNVAAEWLKKRGYS